MENLLPLVKDLTPLFSGFCFVCHPFVYHIWWTSSEKLNKLCPHTFFLLPSSFFGYTSCMKNSYKICFEIFPVRLLLNLNRLHEKRSYLVTSFKQKDQGLENPESFWKLHKKIFTRPCFLILDYALFFLIWTQVWIKNRNQKRLF